MNPAPKPKKRAPKIRKPIPRGGPPKKRNAQRKKSEFARCYHSVERVEFVNGLPCCVRGFHYGPMQNAHTETGGIGRKAGYKSIVPMCFTHHHDLHASGAETFQRDCNIDLSREAKLTDERWASHKQEERGAA